MRKHYKIVLTLMIVIAGLLTVLYFDDFSDKAGLAYAEITSTFSAKLDTSGTTFMEGEYVSFTLIPKEGVIPYHDAKLFCGDGTTAIMEDISVGPGNYIYSGQCRYAKNGKYEAYAEIYDNRKDPNEGTGDAGYNRIESNRLQILITPKISVTSTYVEITVSELEILEYEPVMATVQIHGAEKPYKNVTIYCGRENIMISDYEQDVFSAECIYAVNGEYVIHAEVHDFINTRIISYDVPILVYDRPRDGSGGTGACFPKWECTEWKSCVNGMKARTCTDIYNCDWDYKKPEESMSCVNIEIIEPGETIIEPPIRNEEVVIPQNSGLGNEWIFGLFALFVIIASYVYFKWTTPARKKYVKYLEKIEDTVKRARSKGHSESAIHKNLVAQGHKKHHVRKAMKKK